MIKIERLDDGNIKLTRSPAAPYNRTRYSEIEILKREFREYISTKQYSIIEGNILAMHGSFLLIEGDWQVYLDRMMRYAEMAGRGVTLSEPKMPEGFDNAPAWYDNYYALYDLIDRLEDETRSYTDNSRGFREEKYEHLTQRSVILWRVPVSVQNEE